MMIVKSILLILVIYSSTAFAGNSWLLCGNNFESRTLAELIVTSNQQQRKYLVCDPLLTQLAEEKALEMAEHSMVSHTISIGANQRLKEGGFKLPRFYPLFSANNVEAIQGGADSAEKSFQNFMNSLGHRRHLLGEHPFYQGQSHIGVAYVRSKHSAHLDYWVVYIAHHKDIQPKLNTRLIAKK